MTAPLRLHSLTLPVGDLARADKFYRWGLQLKVSSEAPHEHEKVLGWGNEDRIRLVDGEALESAEEAVGLRVPARPADAIPGWLAALDLEPLGVRAPAADLETLAAAWPGVTIMPTTDEAEENRVEVGVRGPAGIRFDLHVPIPKEVLIPRGRMGPFYRRSADWGGLEIPGLLGVTLGAPQPQALTAFFRDLGVPDEVAARDEPILIGDHQVLVEERESAGVYGVAIVVRVVVVKDLARTIDHLGARHRHDGSRLLAVDPAGRVVVVHGVHSG